MLFVILKRAMILAPIFEEKGAGATSFAVLKLSLVYVTIFESVFAIALKNVVIPLSMINISISKIHRSKSMFERIYKGTLIFIPYDIIIHSLSIYFII